VVDLASRRVLRGGVRGRLSGWVPRTAVGSGWRIGSVG